ncbi:hypothetical protein RO3G_11136 [Lichtheimia corymbifera JMRC:FSU:9682]|uniref:N-acetyltransferase domain-containing protein n=1 Tax=Lichtheimia corymbifera JMRC:FSU:9682 TaxID=1263082 RepID=A0A068SGE7_9FUNG|nr:hypothetical protein RO3G_11136 [Lichtheimia corymbifera JMRC:FSU:9682]
MVHTNLLVRDATVDDLKHTDEVVDIINKAYRSEASWTSENDIVDGPRINAAELEDIVRNNGNPHRILYAFEKDEQGAESLVVGTSLIEASKDDPSEAEVRLFSVRPSHQSRGLGRLIFDASLNRMRELGLRTAVLRVFGTRGGLIEWYKKLGFKETGVLKYEGASGKLKIEGVNFVILKQDL